MLDWVFEKMCATVAILDPPTPLPYAWLSGLLRALKRPFAWVLVSLAKNKLLLPTSCSGKGRMVTKLLEIDAIAFRVSASAAVSGRKRPFAEASELRMRLNGFSHLSRTD